MWQKSTEPFLHGLHTKEICRLIDQAFDDFKKGKSTFLVIKVPFRHGKSDMISRYLPSHFLGEFPDNEVMLVTYGASLSEDLSRFARNLLRTESFNELYPSVTLAKQSSGVQRWGIEGHLGGCVASGLTSGLTGKGYHLGLLDDFNSSRASAESDVIRNGQWEHFTNDFLTRRAPVSITIVLATPWHEDDIIGRIEKRLDKNSESYDPDFPPFKIVSFPAKNGTVEIGIKNKKKYGDNEVHTETITYEYLFPERFTQDWYEQQFSSLGEYSSSALLQCSPQMRGGNLIDTSRIKIHKDVADFPPIRYYRVWDLAHSERQRLKDDPDWTSGTLLGYRKVNGLWELWIKDVVRIRAKAPERDNFIRAATAKDGQGVLVGIEESLDARDAIPTLQEILRGQRKVIGVKTKGDKVVRMSPLEPIFEAGNVHILESDWNFDWLEEVRSFPNGKHDDMVDNLSAGYEICCNNSFGTFYQMEVSGV